MRLQVHQCLVMPASESAELLNLAWEAESRPDIHDATRLAQKLADTDSEPYIVVQIARIINPQREREQ